MGVLRTARPGAFLTCMRMLLAAAMLLTFVTRISLADTGDRSRDAAPADQAVPGGGALQADGGGSAGPWRVFAPMAARSVPPPAEPPLPPPPPPGPPPLGEDLLALQEQIEELVWANQWAGEISVAVTDLQTGELVGVQGHVLRYSGCVLNLFVLLAIMREVEAGNLPLALVGEDVRETIRNSNPVTARHLYGVLGGGDVMGGVLRTEALIKELGFGPDDVVFDHPPGYLEDSLGIDPNNYLTAEAMNRFMAQVWKGESIGGEARLFFLEALLGVKPGLNYLLAVLPDDANVGHKNGFFPGTDGYVDNDAGLVWFRTGEGELRAYAITFLSVQGSGLYSTAWLGQQLSKAAWETFRARYP